MTYTSVPGIPGCGGLLTTGRGTITSPNFPDAYADSVQCDWLIRVHPDDRIQLHFEQVDLEPGPGKECASDWIEIRDGSQESAPLIARYCGSLLPSNDTRIISSRNTVWIRFRADPSFAGRGFRLQYWTTCGGLFDGQESGLISSPNFPDAYPGDRQCLYHIVVPLGHVVLLTFVDFDIVPCGGSNYLQVNSRNGSLIRRMCGQDLPQALMSHLNELVLEFRTDGSADNRGFRSNWSSIDVGCGGVMSQDSGSFSWSSSVTDHVTDCRWLLSAPLPGFIVRLSFPIFSLDCTLHHVVVHDSDHRPLGRFCGTTPPPAVQSSGGDMLVRVESLSSLSSSSLSSSLTAQYIQLNASAACGGHMFAPSGVVRSPGFPDPYPPFRDCVWVLHATTDRHQVVLNVSMFDVENQTSCEYDFLEIRNGGDGTSPLVGRFCGSIPPPHRIVSHSSHLWLRFRSDSSIQAAGFEVWFASVTGTCGGQVDAAPAGLIQSPNYPDPYGHDAECVWIIGAAAGSTVTLTVVDMSLESSSDCQYDYVLLLDGDGDGDHDDIMAKICSPSNIHSHYSSTGNTLVVKFRSDTSGSGRGFRLSYATNCSMQTVTGQRRGVITSPAPVPGPLLPSTKRNESVPTHWPP